MTNPVKAKSRLHWSTSGLILTAIVCGAAAAVLIALIKNSFARLETVDTTINTQVNDWATAQDWLIQSADWLGTAAGPIGTTIVAVVVVIALLIARFTRWAIFLALSSVMGVIVAEVLKNTVGRQRPPGADAFATDTDKSFPSGHTMASIYVFVAIGIIMFLMTSSGRSKGWRLGGVAVMILALVIGMSRVVLGVHWGSDILAGWFLGAAVLLVALAIVHPERTMYPKRQQNADAVAHDEPNEAPSKVESTDQTATSTTAATSSADASTAEPSNDQEPERSDSGEPEESNGDTIPKQADSQESLPSDVTAGTASEAKPNSA